MGDALALPAKIAIAVAAGRLQAVRHDMILANHRAVQTQVDLSSHDLRETILQYMRSSWSQVVLLPNIDLDTGLTVAFGVLEDASEAVDPSQVSATLAEHADELSELMAVALRYLVSGLWRQSRFAEAASTFELFASLADRNPSQRWAWHLSTLSANICNDERQHELARRFAMRALGLAWSLEDQALIQRSQYDHANALSLTLDDRQTTDMFAELRACILAGHSVVDQVTDLSVLIGSARDFMRVGRVTDAERLLSTVEERSGELNSVGIFLYWASQARLAHLNNQTLIRDSKLEDMHWLQSQCPSRTGEQARSHLCFHIAGKSTSYLAMEGCLGLLPEVIGTSVSSISRRCLLSLKRLENCAVT